MRCSSASLHHITPVALATTTLLSAFALAAPAWAEDSGTASLPAVSVKATPAREPRASIAGLGDLPAWQTPVQALSLKSETLANAQVQRLADVIKLDASTSDAYNTAGYWDSFTLRGFVLDNASNFRREGLPINAETRIALDNKASVELLKGTSGLQAGISAPGGLVHLLVKRPEGRIRQAELAYTGGNSVKAAVDLSDRFGASQSLGLRINAASERLDPGTQATDGQRHLLALATDWRIAPGSTLEAEFEHSRHRQPSMPGFSATGNSLPSAHAIDPDTNLNQQPWSQPVDMRGNTGTLRWRQTWSPAWASTVTYGEQHLRTDDRAAFPFGCSAETDYLADRFCSDGSFDVYDFRSDGEKRITRALNAQLTGQVTLGRTRHDLTVGVLRAIHHTDLSTQAFNPVGAGNIATPTLEVGPNADLTYPVADRHERSTEWLLQDAITLDEQWRMWAGVRHTTLARRSLPTDGSPSTKRRESITTPWVSVGYTVEPRTQMYISWGEGAEVKTAPQFNLDNPLEIMPAAKSRQLEIGVKGQSEGQQWGFNWFRIQHPDFEIVDAIYQRDGGSVHRGLEGYWQAQYGQLGVNASAMILDAEREGSAVVADGRTPVNVPNLSLKLSTSYKVSQEVTGTLPFVLQADLVHEGRRWVDKNNTLRLPAWTRVDVGVRAMQQLQGVALTWRLGVSNLFDKRAWREAPNNFGHIWLFPMEARKLTASAQIDF